MKNAKAAKDLKGLNFLRQLNDQQVGVFVDDLKQRIHSERKNYE